jgi:2-polyprenyl-3-methyl-5-hydroxy-6-metoxy-1,4-benzoquinol methylase
LDGLEYLSKCPVCAEKKRSELHQGLSDITFHSAAGKWTMFKCSSCGVSYLDPRPNSNSIGLAYKSYYTHGSEKTSQSLIFTLKSFIVDSYRNSKLGIETHQSKAWGFVLYLNPSLRKRVDLEARGLDKLELNERRTLLDVGSGDGEFLELANTMGYETYGVEPDQIAAGVAAPESSISLGSYIEDISSDYNGFFDVVTISQVIEHVHDPLAMLTRAYELLADGGKLWIETPNIDSLGYRIYGEFWRGLEVPRHLVVYNQEGLRVMMKSVGFNSITKISKSNSRKWMLRQSANLLTSNGDVHQRALIDGNWWRNLYLSFPFFSSDDHDEIIAFSCEK